MFDPRRYSIMIGRCIWFQTHQPVVVKRWFIFWLIKELRATDVDKEPQVLPGTEAMFEGRKYIYVKGSGPIVKNEGVTRC